VGRCKVPFLGLAQGTVRECFGVEFGRSTTGRPFFFSRLGSPFYAGPHSDSRGRRDARGRHQCKRDFCLGCGGWFVVEKAGDRKLIMKRNSFGGRTLDSGGGFRGRHGSVSVG